MCFNTDMPVSTTTAPIPPPQDAPFFVEKLNVRTLPCVVLFVGGVAVDRIVGFDTLGASDDFPTSQVGLGSRSVG